ncbi:MAG TPA: protein translocase subunit SecD [Fluviicola sp.]|nr:protein translocase subunit SecD [Fluviicola sp.]
MRNKGFFWFLTIVLTAVCIYQLSFTLVASNVEKDAAKEAAALAEDLRKETFAMDSTWATLPNNTRVDFSKPESFELAKAAFLNQVLAERAEEEVYPILGSNFQSVKKRSLAFGLDLVGGMSVTLEVSIPELVKSYARNQYDLGFKKPYDRAYMIHTTKGGDFISLFISEYERMYPNRKLVRELNISEIEELKTTSSNAEVEEFFRDKVASSMDGVEQIMTKRINQFGVAQPNIQRDARMNRLFIELPGVQDEKTVAEKLQSTANLQFFETYNLEEIQGPLTQANVMSRQAEIKIPEEDTTATAGKDSTELARLDSIKKAEAASKPMAAANPNQKALFDLLTPAMFASIGTATAENRNDVDRILNRADIKALFPPDLKFMWSSEMEESGKNKKMAYTLYACRIPEDGKAMVGGTDIAEAFVSRNQEKQETTVNLRMTTEGAGKWSEMTAKNAPQNRSIAITMDNIVFSAPRVINAINDGNTEITGGFTIEKAQDLVGLLNGGALPAPCIIKDQTKVGPTIGAENSKAGLISFALAFLAVFIYMYFYYGKAGLVANVALFVNVILIFGALASFGAVLTLAGIAGIVLTIGTAVDANILIFERIREEQARGLDLASSSSVGFSKALPSIIDANVTHLLVAIILKVFGTGEIESFATTLIIGIFTSLFSAIVISKLIITSSIEKGKDVTFNTKFSKGLFQNFKFDWVGKRKYFYIFSIAITILGVVALMTRGLKQSVEFTGGRSYAVKFENKADIEYIRAKLSTVFVENKEVSSIDLKTKSNDYNVEITTNYLLAIDTATAQVTSKLEEGLDKCKDKMGGYEITESRSISASVSNELWKSSAIAITLALIAIFAYILIRFGQWQYSLGAIVSLAHDAMVVLSVFALLHGFLPFSLDVNQAFIAAILTVIGYSMNDTVIVYDRIRENLNNNKDTDDHGAIINKSLNTTLSRTFNTSMILFVVLLVMFIFGGPAIKGFLFALLVGVVIGTYSSLCVATPILIDFNKRFKVKKK